MHSDRSMKELAIRSACSESLHEISESSYDLIHRSCSCRGCFMALCPECEAAIDVEDDEVEEGQTLDCPECGAELEVVSTNPVELNTIADEGDEEAEDEW